MNIISIKTYKGRNIYNHKPVLKLLIDLEELSDKTTLDFNEFNDKLLELFPSLITHHCGLGKHGGFVERIREGTYFGHVVEHLCLELQVLVGYNVYFGKTRQSFDNSLYDIIVEYINENVAIECVKQSVNIVEDIIDNLDIDLDYIINRINKVKDKYEFGQSTMAIYQEAKKRGIPVRRLGHDSILELGYGKYSRLIQAALTDSTSGIAIDISCNKQITKQLLKENNIPIPKGDIAYTLDEALDIAHDIGYPVVLKPMDGNQGKGVVLDINSPKELEYNIDIPFSYSNGIIVEKYIKGKDFRILVVNDKVSAVAQRKPPMIIGDGIHTIEELVDIENSNELRGTGHEKPLTKIRLDSIALSYLEKFNMTEETVPDKGQIVKLRENGNISTGGSAVECTDIIHPENKKLAIQAAKIIGLDIAGIDMITEDVSKSIRENGGAIIEINTAPGLRMHLAPTEGKSINVAADILDFIFPSGTPYSIPIIATTGTNGKTTTTRLIGHTLKLSGKRVGMTTTSGIFIDNKCILDGDNTGPISTRNILSSKEIDVAVLEVARGGIVRGGLGYDLADVGIVTNIGNDHIGLDGVETYEELAFVKSLVLEAVKHDGFSIINADDNMADYLMNRASGNIILFSKKENNKRITDHVSNGNTAVYVEDNSIYIHNNFNKTKLIELSYVPITFNGTLECNIENVLAACSALFALGLSTAIIREGLTSFKCDINMNPGRFNIFEINDVKIMIDYGHNIGGYEEVGKFVKSLDVSRSIGVIGVPGDRPDEQIYNIGLKCPEFFSRVYIKEDRDLRGRKPGEVASILQKGLLDANFNPDNITIELSEIKALEAAIRESQAGDFITFFYEKLEPAVELINRFKDELTEKVEFTITKLAN